MLVVAATFVAEPLAPALSWLLRQIGLDTEIRFAPYHQVFQELLTLSSELCRNADINLLLVRLEDFIRDSADARQSVATLERVSSELAAAVASFQGRSTSKLIVALFDPTPHVGEINYAAVLAATRKLAEQLSAMQEVVPILAGDLDELVTSDGYDGVQDALGHVPYTAEYFAALALVVARRIHAVKGPIAKVLALDCDNTLWRGVVGEDGVHGVAIGACHTALQEFAIAQQAKGILICLLSKNSEADVWEVFDQRADMRLKRSHIVSHRIDWKPKPANLKALAAELNLGLDSFVFIDDSPVECAQMRAELPQVTTLQLPAEEEVMGFLGRLWMFDKLTTTAEDANRTQMYRENAARRAMESTTNDAAEFLTALQVRVDIATPDDGDWARIEQLTQRTNQFNFTTRRHSSAELRSLLRAGSHVVGLRVSDRFGDYGLVGVLIAERQSAALVVDTFLLSCRVLGRGVEHAALRHLGVLANELGCTEVHLPFLPTARNVPARAFADSVAGEFAEPSGAGTLYRLPAAHAAQALHRPGEDPQEITDARRADERKAAGVGSTSDHRDSSASDRSTLYARVAGSWVSGRAVCEQLRGHGSRAGSLSGSPAVAVTPTEIQLLALWEELLEIDGLGVEDNYFDLGGTSLLSVRLFAEISRRFNVDLALATILEAPTVRSLAQRMMSDAAGERGGVVPLRLSGATNLFLVHDGLGETLLYLNLAHRLPRGISVYGIEPKRLPGIPLAHGSLEEMAAHYVREIRSVQPKGPYLLGGMCAGGVIAYAMAVYLRREGERVELVTIMDGATPQAARQVGRTTQRRLSRLGAMVAAAEDSTPQRWNRWPALASCIFRKAMKVVGYEVSSTITSLSVRLRVELLRGLVKRGAGWPSALPRLSVMQIYNALEARYRPARLADVPVLLVRASVGQGDDAPYRERYRDEHLGWAEVADKLEIVDVHGGHSSMLQERAIDSLASVLTDRLTLSEST